MNKSPESDGNLLNHTDFENRLKSLLIDAQTIGAKPAVCCVTINSIDHTNCSCRDVAVNGLSRDVLALLKAQLHFGEAVTRLDDNSFDLLLNQPTRDEAAELIESILASICALASGADGGANVLTASIGVVQLAPDMTSVTAVMRSAESACAQAFAAGGSRIRLYDHRRSAIPAPLATTPSISDSDGIAPDVPLPDFDKSD